VKRALWICGRRCEHRQGHLAAGIASGLGLSNFELNFGVYDFQVGEQLIRRDLVDSVIDDFTHSSLVDSQQVGKCYLG